MLKGSIGQTNHNSVDGEEKERPFMDFFFLVEVGKSENASALLLPFTSR